MIAPSEMIPGELDGDVLKGAITKVVGANAKLKFRMQVRYYDLIDLGEG